MTTRNQVEVNGINISYLTSGIGKDVIVFLHGNGMAAKNWLPQLENEELKSKYTLIAIDLPGHGRSGWAQDDKSVYNIRNIAHLIKPLLEKCNAKSFMLVGLSLGTNVIAEIDSPLEGCKGLMLVSPCIVNDQNLPSAIITAGQYGYVIASANPPDEDLRAYVSEHMKNKKLADQYIIDYRNADPSFREQLLKMMVEASWTDELSNIQRWNVPICVVFGKNDSLLKIDYLDNFSPLWNKKVYFIENAAHFVNEDQPELFNEILLTYASERFK